MTCQTCGKTLLEATTRRRFCNATCRARAWRRERAREVAEALDQAERALEKARRALRRGEDKP